MKKRHFAAVIAALIAVASLPTVADATITGVSGQMIKIPAPPSVVQGAAEHPTSILAFDERQGVTLLSNLRVDIVSPGTYDQSSDLQNTDVLAGTKVDSHYLHSDRPPGGATVRTGTVTFPTEIVGVIVQSGRLPDSDHILGSGVTLYPAPTNRGLEFGGGAGADIVILPDLRTLTVTTATSTGTDDLRVITRHNSPPIVSAGGARTGVEGAPVTLNGTATDADGDALTRSWTFTWTGDPGTVCTATGTTTLTPTVTCNDDAMVTPRLSVSDGVNPPVISTSTLTISNQAPALGALTAPTTPVPLATPVSVSAAFTDAGSNDTHTATVSWGDTTSSPATVTETAGSGSAAASHTYAAPGVYTVTVTLTDDDLGTSVQTAQVSVNGPPTSDAGGPYTGAEGLPTGLVGTSLDPENDPLTTTWTFAPTGLDPGGACSSSGASTLVPSITCNDDAVVDVQLSASDGINPAALSSTTVAVENEAPVLGTPVGPLAAVPAGAPVSVLAPFTDGGTNDTHTATVSWGDLSSSPATITESSGSGALSATHSYGSPGLYTVTVTLTDDDLGVDTATLTILVNSPPSADAGGPYVGSEGDTLTLAGSALDVDGDPLSISWSFATTGSPGTVCTPSGTATLSPTLVCNDDATVTATLTVSDGVNPAVVDTATLEVGNLVPVVSPAVASAGPAPAGSTVTVGLGFTDAGTNDSHTATIDWGDATTSAGAVTESGGSGSVSGAHVYATHGTYDVTVTVTDDDGGPSSSTVTVVVNGAPSVDAGGPYSGAEGAAIALSGTATDPEGGALDIGWTFTWTGDAGTTCSAAGAATLSPVLSCTDDASVTAKLTVSDGVNPAVVKSTTVTVGNVAPTVSSVAPSQSPVATGSAVSVGVTFGDVGINDTHTATVQWGDATSSAGVVTESGGSGSVSASHVYNSPGTYEVTVTVTDDDGGSASSSVDIIVNGSPIAGAGGPYEGIEGTAVTLSGTAEDPDADVLTVSWTRTIVSSDPGTTCALADASTLTPTLTCNDDATVDVTVTVSDGINAPVVDTGVVTIDNADPIVTAPVVLPNPVAVGAAVNLTSSFTDPGANDDHTASVSWGDSTTTSATVTETLGSGGSAAGNHTFTSPGTYPVKVTVNDKDGGTASATTMVVVSAPPTVDAGGPYTVEEGSAKVLTGSANDPEGDALGIGWSFTWTGSPGTSCIATGTSTLSPSITCDDDAVVTATLTASDAINAPVSDTGTLTVGNGAPVIAGITLPGGTVSVGTPVPAVAAFTDPGTHDTHTGTIEWGDSATSVATIAESGGAGTASGSHVYSAPGTYAVKVTITDDDGTSTSATGNLVVNGAPVVSAGGPYSGVEGSPTTLAATATDPDLDPLGIAWSFAWTGGAGTACTATGTATLAPSVTCDDDAVVTATLTVTDGVNAPVVRTATVNVANAAPTAGTLTAPVSPVSVGSAVNVLLTFADAGRNDTHTATVSWGDSTTSSGTVSEVFGSGSVSASKAFPAPGLYNVSVTLTDDDGGSVVATSANPIVVYDPSAGFVTGGGWVMSPSGAYTPNDPSDPDVTGKSNFGFNSKYVGSNDNLNGQTQFNFHTGNALNFHSSGYSWLVVENGKTKAYYQGTGKVNGVTGYAFAVSVIDGRQTQTSDRFRMKVWKTSTGDVVYDTQNGDAVDASAVTPISGGSIVIH